MPLMMELQTPILDIAVRLSLAAVLGAVIGFDREMKNRPAGLRTHMLTALAAALFTVITFELHHFFATRFPNSNADPLRVIEAITAGVAFLAAGSIFVSRGNVQGVTTGAGMWLAGALGLASGAGYFAVAAIGLVIAMVIMTVMQPIERWLSPPENRDAERKKPE